MTTATATKVRVATQGDEVREVDFVNGMRLKDALAAAHVKPAKDAKITVNGRKAKLRTKVAPGDLVIATPNVSNG